MNILIVISIAFGEQTDGLGLCWSIVRDLMICPPYTFLIAIDLFTWQNIDSEMLRNTGVLNLRPPKGE